MVSLHLRPRGGALGLVLAVAALALLAAFTAANVATINVRVSSTVANASIAEALAESVVQEALANLQQDLGFHETLEIGPGLGLPEGSRGYLSFDRTTSEVYSTNNFLGDQADAWNRTLPETTAHLVGVGECGGVEKIVEVVVHLPEFPVAMACDGPVRVSNSFIGGFDPEKDREWVPGEGYQVEEDEFGPGHLITNSTTANSIVLDRRSRVTGDVQSLGGVQLNGATVEGEVRAPWGKRAPLPKFDLTRFDPAREVDIPYEDLLSPRSSLTLVGNLRREGDLNLSGSLTLDNAFLFVNGDLTVDRNLRGLGAIVVTGKVKFSGAVDLAGNDQIAILSGGGIEVEGRDADRSIFKGLLYTKGPFVARKITVVGGFMVDDGASTEIIDSTIYYSGANISPAHRREVAAVIPRFTSNPTGHELRFDESTRHPIGRWMTPRGERHVANVTNIEHPEWRRSNWEMDDPAVLRVRWVNDQPQYRYEYWGHNSASSLRQNGNFSSTPPDPEPYPSTITNWMNDLSSLARVVTQANTGSNVHDHLDGTPPTAPEYEAFFRTVAQHLEQPTLDVGEFNFSFDPNEFLNQEDKLRILLHRVL
ncbi:MAG: hypothetical protein WC314_09930 [Vulcanimicrobiota bacterium]